MLRAILLRNKIAKANKQLEDLRAKADVFETRKAELETAINEARDAEDLTDDDTAALETEVEKFDADKKENDEQIDTLQASISEMERELDEIEAANEPKPATDKPAEPIEAERKVNIMPNMRFAEMSYEQRAAFVEREENKEFLAEVRNLVGQAIKNHRAVTGAGLTITESMLPLVKSTTESYSKLLKHVRNIQLSGSARQPIMGDIPEGIWIECCGNINELNLTFTDKDIDCYKNAGFIPVCNSTLEDSDIDLMNTILEALGKSLGYATDKAIAFGNGTKMPAGAFTSTSVPASNKITLQSGGSALTGKALFQAIIRGLGNAKHASGDLFWIMNEKTRLNLVAEALEFNANGALVSGVGNTMPIVGGAIETLDFIADDEMYAGYGDRYLLGIRKGITLSVSEEYRFVQDQTILKGVMRADGKPVFADAFVAFSTAGAPSCDVDSSHPFPTDEANEVQVIVLDKAVATVKTTKTIKLNATLLPEGAEGEITWASSDSTKATVEDGVVTGVATGSTIITATCNGRVAACTVTVTN